MATPQPLPRWARWFGASLVLVAVGLFAWGAWPKWSTAAITQVVVDGPRLDISTDTCGARDVDTAVDEGTDIVTITIHVYDEPRSQDCVGEQLTLTLDAPLGERDLVDGADDEVLRCEPPGATRQECVR